MCLISKKCWLSLAIIALACLGGLSRASEPKAPGLWPGRQADGSMLLPNQWSLRPVGTQIELGDFPVNMVLSPDGHYVAVLHCGFGQHEVRIVDLARGCIVSHADLNESFYGLDFSPDGRKLYCSGASDELVYVFNFQKGLLTAQPDIRVRPAKELGVPVGLTVSPNGKTLYVANLWNSRVSTIALGQTRSVQDILLENTAVPVQTVPSMPAEDFDTAAANKRAKAAAAAKQNDPNGVFPYACILDARHDRLYVSLWGAAAVSVVDLKSQQPVARWEVGEHPCEMALRRDGKFLFVANANDNTVTVLDTKTGRAVEHLWATLFPNSPRGATPISLALSPDEKMLFVANANINAVAVFDVSQPGRGRSLGFIPSGWYPTCVRVTPDGKHLLIANGKGDTAKANPHGPQPVRGASREEYIGNLLKGTLSVVDLPTKKNFTQQLAAWTAEVLKCTPLRPDASVVVARSENNPIPGRVGESSPITHCIYIIKENRTYDQVFGDIKEGNGDPSLCLFPEPVTPNLHKLVHQFVLLDNFYADAEVSADGHEWSMAGYATDFVEKTWPLNYGHKKSKFSYPSEGVFNIATPASGYLWDRAAEAGISYRSYGEFVQNAASTNQPVTSKRKGLEGHFDPWYRSFDLDYADAWRANRFISELHRFEKEGDMPRLQIVRLPNDHTRGVAAGKPTPTAYVAENDAALGRVVEAVSRSQFWPHTAIFVVEDDAQNGPDHVDAHRTEALVISPYTKHGAVDSTLYSTTSMLRTMELILGLQPMTQFDAAATPMFNSFQPVPDLDAYVAVPANVDVHATNSVAAWGGQEKFNFAEEDANDDIQFNEVIWRSVKGANHPMPAPMHAGFVLVSPSRDDD